MATSFVVEKEAFIVVEVDGDDRDGGTREEGAVVDKRNEEKKGGKSNGCWRVWLVVWWRCWRTEATRGEDGTCVCDVEVVVGGLKEVFG